MCGWALNLSRCAVNPSTQIGRLLIIVIFAVHFFACGFWRVASENRTPEEMDTWLSGKHVPADVSKPPDQHSPTDAAYAAAPQTTSAFDSKPARIYCFIPRADADSYDAPTHLQPHDPKMSLSFLISLTYIHPSAEITVWLCQKAADPLL
jgi:hypothetical protein